MRVFQKKIRFNFSSIVATSLLMLAVTGCASVSAESNKKEFKSVELTGVQHIGPDFNISDFYVDGQSGSNVGRGGGGGRLVCCVALPKKWRPDLSVEVRWAVNDWSKEIVTEADAGNYNSVTSGGVYKARVPVEKYDTAEHLWAHFFAGGKVRIVSSSPWSVSKEHPIQRGDLHAADNATTGTRVDSLFTAEELAEINRKNEESKKKYGDWR